MEEQTVLQVIHNDKIVYLSRMWMDANRIPEANVECFKCSNVEMVPVKLEYTKYVQMSGEERENYVESLDVHT